MKINRLLLPLNKDEVFNEDIDFSKEKFDENHVKRIVSCSVNVTAHEYGDVLDVKIRGKASVIASCSYTLEDVPLDVSFKENFYFSNEVTGSDECFYEPSNEIDLDPHILALILAEVPHNIVKKGAKRPSGGEGYRVLSEDEFLEERKNKKTSAFDILDTIEFDEEDNN